MWEKTNFREGINTKPGLTEGGEYFARDASNLIVDADGFMRVRNGIVDVGPWGHTITGIASTPQHIFVLRDNGRLYIRLATSPENEEEVLLYHDKRTQADSAVTSYLYGRLSLADFGTYVILTSEGFDQGYWVDLSNYTPGVTRAQGYPLGIDAPDAGGLPDSKITLTSNREKSDGIWVRGSSYQYAYKIAYARRSNDTDLIFNGVVSKAAQPDRILLNNELGEEHNGTETTVTLTIDHHSADPQVIGVNIYRTDQIEPSTDLDKAVFRLIAFLPKTIFHFTGLTQYVDNGSGYEPRAIEGISESLEWQDCEIFIDNNDRMPSSCKAFTYHAGRLFAVDGQQMRLTDFEGTREALWRFPVNEIVRPPFPDHVDFVTSFGGFLIYGGSNALYRLSGSDVSDFRNDKISGVGPLNPHSWGFLKNSIGFIGASGLYVTDGDTVENVSETALDEYFSNQLVHNGTVAHLQDNTSLFAVSMRDRGTLEVENHVFVFNDKHWMRWSDIRIDSFAVAKFLDNRYLFSDFTGRIKEIDLEIDRLDENIEWYWSSNLIDDGRPAEKKRFRRIEVLGEATDECTLTVWTDIQKRDLDAWTIDGNLWSHDGQLWGDEAPKVKKFNIDGNEFYWKKIPIFCLSRRLRFSIAGQGTCTIRGLRVVVD